MSAIDFKLAPVDTLVDVRRDVGRGIATRLFSGDILDGEYGVCEISKLVRDNRCITYAPQIRISAKNPWLPWFGGECPVPPNCVVQVHFRSDGGLSDYLAEITNGATADNFIWSHDYSSFYRNIIAYRLLESPWQTISGVCDE